MARLRSFFQAFGPLILLLALGLHLFHGSLFKDSQGWIHGDLGDARLISIFLEHSYNYLFRLQEGLSYWSPSWIYFPAKNGLAYSDVMTGGVFLYAPWRALGFSEMESYQFWFVSTSILNFFSFILLGRRLGLSWLGVTVGAYVASFSLTNIAYANHPQLLTHYFLFFLSYFALRIFQTRALRKRLFFAAAAAFMYAVQVWTAFYPLWFFTLVGGVAAIFLIFHYRQEILREPKLYVWPFLTFGLTAGLLIFPILKRYFVIKNQMGPRSWEEISQYLPTWHAYLLPTGESVLYKTLLWERLHSEFRFFSELSMFSGFCVLLVPFLFLFRRKVFSEKDGFLPLMTALAFAVLIAQLLMLKWGKEPDAFTLWKAVFHAVPGASAIRAVARTSLVLNLFSAVLIAFFLSSLQMRAKRGLLLTLILSALIVAENASHHQWMFSVKESEQRLTDLSLQLEQTGKDCQTFHRSFRPEESPFREIDSMLLSQRSGLPTSNGYSGGMPPPYWDAGIYTGRSLEKIEEWFTLNNYPIDRDRICFLN